MSERPNLDENLDSKTFRDYYYLKEELMDFCRRNNLQSTGGKLELVMRIVEFLDTGKRTYTPHAARKTKLILISSLNIIPILEISLMIIRIKV